MRERWSSLLAAALVGCTAANPAFGDAEGGSFAETGGTSGSSATATTATSASGSTGSSGVESSTNGGIDSTTNDGGSSSDGEGGSSSTGNPDDPGQCWNSISAELSIHVHKNGADVGPCAVSINISGPVVLAEGGYFEVESCGGCGACGGDVYAFDLAIAPDTDAFDPTVPDCVNVVTTPGTEQIAPDVCSTSGIVIRSTDASADPVYIGSAGQLVPPIAAPADFDFDLVETGMMCECWGMCCLMTPGLYRLGFPAAGIAGLDEGQNSATVPVGLTQSPYEFTNLGSHIHPNCAHRPHIDYVIRRAG